VLAGWWLDVGALKSVLPGYPSMMPLTAACLAFCGAGLVSVSPGPAPARGLRRWIAVAGCAVPTVVGLLTLAQFATGARLGVDSLLFPGALAAAGGADPGRMSSVTALVFVLIGIALGTLGFGPGGPALGQPLALAALLVAGLALAGYALGAEALYRVSTHSAMAIHTASLHALLAVGVLCARPESGVMRLVTSAGAGGEVVRRLLPFVVAIPLVAGWLQLRGERAGYYDPSFGAALLVAVNVVAMIGVLWANAQRIESADDVRRLAVDTRRAGEERTAGIVGSAMDAIITLDERQHVTVFNAAAERMFGYPAASVLGQPVDRLIPGRFRGAHADHVRAFGRTNVTRRAMGELGAIYGLRAGGEEFPIEASISHVELGGEKVFTVILRDISERLRAEQSLRDAQEALRSSERRLAGIIGSAMDAIITVDGSLRITLFNAAAERMFGRSAARMLGEPLDRLIPGRFRSGHAEHVRSFGRTNVTRRSMGELGSIYGLRADGGEFPIEASISQVETGGEKHFTVILRDITERRLAEEALVQRADRASLLAEIASAMASVVDDYHELLETIARRVSERIGDFCSIEVLAADGAGREASALFHPDAATRERLRAILADRASGVEGGPAVADDETCFHADASPEELRTLLPLRLRALPGELPVRGAICVPLRSQREIVGALALFRTQRPPYTAEDRALVQELADRTALAVTSARLFAQMEKRVAERTAELQAKNRELEAFSYSVSHDLKAPLRGIEGYSHLLLLDHAGKLDDEGRGFLVRVQQAARQMSRLIDDLLSYTRLERLALQAQALKPSALVEALLAERRDETTKRGVRLRVELPDVSVRADPQGLSLVLRNLLDNALKFLRAGAVPELEIGGRVEPGVCVLWVKDNGVGFDMKFHDRIFEIFQRLQRAEDYPGTGVGLAMVRKAAERMGGRVWAASAPGEGATFFVEIPR
jgi:PAS domain S-box-containing protein